MAGRLTTRILVNPPAAGKTQVVLDALLAGRGEGAVTYAWVILPHRNQAASFRRRLAEASGAWG